MSGEPKHGNNGGPPLDQSHEWGEGPFGNYFEWKAAHAAAWKVPYDTAIMRARRAESLGLTYEEYALEIMERGRYLQVTDVERIDAIKRKRPVRY